MNKLMKIENIEVVQGIIKFPEYKKLKKEAADVAEFVKNIKVDEENIKESKKLLAAINKSISKLEDKRKAVKSEIIKPYTDFETQVKEIVTIVKNADEIVRTQVKDLEEEERQKKAEDLREIWNLRIEQYDFAKVISFDNWLIPKHLNKTASFTKVEDEMVEFLEKCERDIEILSTMEDSEDLILEYKKYNDVSIAIRNVKIRKEEKKKTEEIIGQEKTKKTYLIKIFNEKDLKMTELLLKENEINFERV